ncbi:MAG: trypsin-like serine protease [Anaerolineae bacterium]
MRKLVVVCLLVMLLGGVVPVPGTLAGEPDQASEPIMLIGASPNGSEPLASTGEALVENGAPAHALGEGLLGERSGGPVPNDIRGADNRRRVWTTTEDPYRAIVHLEITRADGKPDFCTGFFVRPDRIMTAGHCVYQYDSAGRPLARRGWVNTVKVIPARSWQWENGQRVVKKPFGEALTVYLETNTAWAGDRFPGTHDHDYGFVLLPDQTLFNRINTLFAVQNFVPQIHANWNITISGYPCDKSWFVGFVRNPNCGHPENPPEDVQRNLLYPTGLWELWTDAAAISSIVPSTANPLQFNTLVGTVDGQDGAPCWYTHQDADWQVAVAIGVFVDGSPGHNACVAFRPQIVDMIGQTATIRGTVKDGRQSNHIEYGHDDPLEDVAVMLYDDETGNLLDAVATDENGEYMFLNVAAGKTYRLRVYLTDGWGLVEPLPSGRGPRRTTLRITDGANDPNKRGREVYLEAPVTVPADQPDDQPLVQTVNLDFSQHQTGVASPWAGDSRLSDFGLMYTEGHKAMRYIQAIGIQLPGVLTIQGYSMAATMPANCVDTSAAGVSCYNPDDATLYLSADGQNNRSNYSQRGDKTNMRFTIYHEVGHYLLDQTRGLPSVSGIWSDDAACSQAQGNFFHAGFCDSTTAASLLEGFADFFVSVMKNDPKPWDATLSGWTIIDLELKNYQTAPHRGPGLPPEPEVSGGAHEEMKAWDYLVGGGNTRAIEYEEWAVAGLLWDLIDDGERAYPVPCPAGEQTVECSDNLAIREAALLRTILVDNIGDPLDDVPDLYALLLGDDSLRSVFQGDVDHDGVSDLAEIFVAHGFFDAPGTTVKSTMSNEPIWDGDLDKIGYGGRRVSPEENRQLPTPDPELKRW